jgi:hypothetical protein
MVLISGIVIYALNTRRSDKQNLAIVLLCVIFQQALIETIAIISLVLYLASNKSNISCYVGPTYSWNAFLYRLQINFKEKNPSWQTDGRSNSQDMPRVLGNQKVQHRSYKRLTLVSILSQLNPVNSVSFHFFHINFNANLQFSPTSSNRSLSFISLDWISLSIS